MKLSEFVSLCVLMGCNRSEADHVRPDGSRIRVVRLVNPETLGFVAYLQDQEDGTISLAEIEQWERLLKMDIPHRGRIQH